MEVTIVKYESNKDLAFAKAKFTYNILDMKNEEKPSTPLDSTNSVYRSKPEENSNEKQPSFAERWKNSKYLFVRGSYVVAHSIWTVVMVVGMAIAWLVAVLAT